MAVGCSSGSSSIDSRGGRGGGMAVGGSSFGSSSIGCKGGGGGGRNRNTRGSGVAFHILVIAIMGVFVHDVAITVGAGSLVISVVGGWVMKRRWVMQWRRWWIFHGNGWRGSMWC